MILGSQAKLENDNRGLNVIRGLHNKAANGWRPGQAPIGYLNNGLGEEKIIIDEERSAIMAEMFERVAKQAYTGRDVKRWLDDIDFRSRQGKTNSFESYLPNITESLLLRRVPIPKSGSKTSQRQT
jgi:DNA invertase Pin-like site-specific DNA recombinase